jgi:integrase
MSMNRPRKKDRHLPACCYQRHGAVYYVKRGQWTRLGPASDLPRVLAEYARLQSHGTGGMAALIEEALPTLTDGRAPATVKLYTLAARKLQAILAEFAPHQVQPMHVAQLRRGMADTPVMANRCLSVLRMVFDYAVEEQMLDANPCIGAKRNHQPKRTRRITVAEFRAIRAAASDRLQIVMDLCLHTGQRIGDVLTIQRADLTDDGIYVKQQKTGAELVVRWTAELRVVVESAKAAHGRVASMWLVKGMGSKRMAYAPIWRDWRAACKAAGVTGANIHDLRAMSGTEAKRQGLDARALLGHTSERMTAQYLRDRELPIVDGPSFGVKK